MLETKKTITSTYESKNNQIVKRNYEELSDLISSLSSKLSIVYGYNEKEFLSAYRVHTVELQSELRELKERVKRAEESLNDDDAVAKLEHELNWFSGEATRLRTQVTSMRHDAASLVDRMKALKDQREFLSEQLKAVLKKTRVLESELESASGMYPTTPFSQNGNSKPRGESYSSQDSFGECFSYQDEEQQQIHNATIGKKMAKKKPSTKLRRPSEHRIQDSLTYQKPVLDPSNSMTPTDIAEAIIALEGSRPPVEYALENALAGVFQDDILPRKLDVAKRDTTRGFQTLRSQSIRATDFTGLGLKHFTDTDKFNAMVRFLSDRDNFQMIIQVIKAESLL